MEKRRSVVDKCWDGRRSGRSVGKECCGEVL